MRNPNSCDLNNDQSAMDENESAEEFVVEEIVAKRYNSKTKQFEYLLKWEGYPSEQNTWEPYENLTSCRYLIQEYEKRLSKRHFRKLPGTLLPKTSDSSNIKSTGDSAADTDIGNSKKSKVKSLITLDGSVISSDSPEWANHINQNNHVDNDRQYDVNESDSQLPEPEKSKMDVDERHDLNSVTASPSSNIPEVNSIEMMDTSNNVPSEKKEVDEESSPFDGDVSVSKNSISNIPPDSSNDDHQTPCSVETTSFLPTSVRTTAAAPLQPPKKRIFNESMLSNDSLSASTKSAIPEVTSTLLVSSSYFHNSVVSSKLVTDGKERTASNDVDNNLDEIIRSSVRLDSPFVRLAREKSGVYEKSKSDNSATTVDKFKEAQSLNKLLSPNNRVKVGSIHVQEISSGIYLFDRDAGLNCLNSDSEFNPVIFALTELLETKKRVLYITDDDMSPLAFSDSEIYDLSKIFKLLDASTPTSGAVIQKETAINLGIYSRLNNSDEGYAKPWHDVKTVVQRGSTHGFGSIKTKHTPILPKPPSNNQQQVKSQRQNTILYKSQSGKSEFEQGNRLNSPGLLKRTSDSVLNNSFAGSVFEKKNTSTKSSTPNSSLRKLLGTFNPNRRLGDSFTDVSELIKNEESKDILDADAHGDQDDVHMEDDFPNELIMEPLDVPETFTLDPKTGVKLMLAEGEDALQTALNSSSPEVSPFSSPRQHSAVIENNTQLNINDGAAVGVILKAANDDADGHQMNAVGTGVMDEENNSVVLQVEMGAGGDHQSGKSQAVNMANLDGINNDNLVTITGEDGLVYQVENAKIDGDTIFVSPDEEPQCVYELPDGNKVVRRTRIDGVPIFTLDDLSNNSIHPLNINEINILPDGCQIIVKQDDSGYTVQISPPQESEQQSVTAEEVDSTETIPISEPEESGASLKENIVENVEHGQELVATVVEAGELPTDGSKRKVVLLLPDGNLMMTEFDEEQFAALNFKK